MLTKIEVSISEVVLSYVYKKLDHLNSSSQWDSWITRYLQALKSPPSHGLVATHIASIVKRKNAKWCPPPYGSLN